MDQEQTVIERAGRLLKKKYHARHVYVFGSYVSGGYLPGKSDLDIAVFLPRYQEFSLENLAGITYEVQNEISALIELHFFPEIIEPLTFSDYIVKHGRKIA